ncbi:hypothetical protein HMN09_00230000 [Mycena chlorophos]|uniref:TPR-like protein n=1 Tax=Mycena chlorophos TaxID=658473 RepID=A0A8H6TLK2_MYCCL|nr:hypothetical protein HMN09_00230000 [Mycena chlorophos]
MSFATTFGQSLPELLDEEEEEDPTSSSESSPDASEDETDNEVPEKDESNAELLIEGEFDRLVDNIKLQQGPSTGLLSKDWDFNIQDQDAQFRDDLRAASGVGKRRNKKKGRAPGPVLSYEVKSLLGDGNQAYVDGNIPETIRIMLEVIRIEPRAASPWSVLAQCHEDMGQHQQALQLRIMAAHLRHDEEEWERLAQQSKELGYTRQAIYCLGKLVSLDPTNINAQWDRALLSRELGDYKTTRNAFLNILKLYPHDLTVLSELRTILIELSDLETCMTLFTAAFQHYQGVYPSGHGPHPTTQEDVPGGGFGYLELLVLADLLNTTGAYGRAVDVIRQGVRWLQGRSLQRYWDICDDDREYDVPETPRLIENGPQPGYFPLDINVRHRLLIARIKMGELEEAKLHAATLLSEDILDYAPLFVEVADAYFEREQYAEARPIYETLGAETTTSSLYILLQTAACLRMLNELRESAEVYEYIRGVEPTDNETKLKLAEIYEILNEPRKALELVYEVIDSRKRNLGDSRTPEAREPSPSDAQAPSASLFTESAASEKATTSRSTKSRMSTEALKQFELEMESETIKGQQRLIELYPSIRKEEEPNEAEREWLILAEKLVEAFRETRQLFSTSRTAFRGMFPHRGKRPKNSEADQLRLASRLQLELESGRTLTRNATDIFRGLHFQQWLQLFFQYAFLLTVRGQFSLADELLKHILLAVPFRSLEMQTSIRFALISTGTLPEVAKKLNPSYQSAIYPVICISLASDNRHHLVTQVRLFTHAAKHYTRVLEQADNIESRRRHTISLSSMLRLGRRRSQNKYIGGGSRYKGLVVPLAVPVLARRCNTATHASMPVFAAIFCDSLAMSRAEGSRNTRTIAADCASITGSGATRAQERRLIHILFNAPVFKEHFTACKCKILRARQRYRAGRRLQSNVMIGHLVSAELRSRNVLKSIEILWKGGHQICVIYVLAKQAGLMGSKSGIRYPKA